MCVCLCLYVCMTNLCSRNALAWRHTSVLLAEVRPVLEQYLLYVNALVHFKPFKQYGTYTQYRS